MGFPGPLPRSPDPAAPMKWFARHPRTVIALLGILMISAGGLAVGTLNVRNLNRIALIQSRLSDLERIRELRHRLEVSLLDDVREAVPVGSFVARDVRLQVENALALQSYLDPETAAGLRQIAELLSQPGMVVTRSTLVSALELAGSISEAEARAQRNLLADVQQDGRRESFLGITILMALASLTAVASWLIPKRILDPLSGLRERFTGVAAGHFGEVPTAGLDPALLPLFGNYNAMVARLSALEEERRSRAETLEEEVRAATRTLVDQHRTLANAQRLAAVGETAAGVAHELRNPLAGMMAALENLQKEVTEPDILRRLGALHAETKRVVGLLNNYLAAARHEPEPLVSVDLAELVQELVGLLRYQVPAGISLEHSVESGLRCALPRDRIRQVLLNLVWNAVEAVTSSTEGSTGTITVAARASRGEKPGVKLEVIDDGPGFPLHLLEAEVQSFRSTRPGGTGLGLAMVARTAHDLGGTVTLSNREPHGASVCLTIPCNPRREE